MKKTYGKISAIVIAVTLFVFMGVMQTQAWDDGSVPFSDIMFAGQKISYHEIRGEYGYSSQFRKVENSNPEVISVTFDSWSMEIEALSPGTSDIYVVCGFGDDIRTTVTVYESDQFSMDCCTDKVVSVGDELLYETINVQIGGVTEAFDPEDFSYSSSNWDVCSASADSDGFEMWARQQGEAEITVTLKRNTLISSTFKVTVNKLAPAKKPKIPTQIATANKAIYAEIESDQIYVGLKPGKVESEYEIYISEKKNKGYKKVGWMKSYYSKTYDEISETSSDSKNSVDHDYGEIIPVRIKKYNKKKLKANKKYYVKVRVRYTGEDYDNSWSAFSAVREYWTSPGDVPKKSIKYNSRTGKLSFPKVKGAVGYYYSMSSFTPIGYNIFGGRVYLSENRTTYTTKNSLTAKKINDSSFAEEISYVQPYSKHNGYYFMSGRDPFKKLSTLEDYDFHRWAASP